MDKKLNNLHRKNLKSLDLFIRNLCEILIFDDNSVFLIMS